MVGIGVREKTRDLGEPRFGKRWTIMECLTMFAIGAAIMHFIYLDPRGLPPDQVGVPGFDAFYHVKMAAMLPEWGLVDHFPWLRHVYFSQLNDAFVSHHYGFHVLLVPFVKVSHWLTGDYLQGGRWAITTFFGLNVMLMNALLMSERIRWRWLWLLVFLMLPAEFFGRHAFVRAISPSLVFMLLIILTSFRGRYVLAGVTVAAYTHLYLGAVVFSPVIVGLCVLSHVVGPREDRCLPWRLVMWTTLGWLVGLRTYPYFDGALEFLRLQILGTGLSPDIAVGSEWSSYGNVWHFAVRMCGPLLGAWGVALALRLRLGQRLNARELTLVLLNFALLLLTLKAKRFIEYWPPFCLLSAAYLAAPILNPLAAWFEAAGAAVNRRRAAWLRPAAVIATCVALLVGVYVARPRGMERFAEGWPLWLLLGSALVVVQIGRNWNRVGFATTGLRRFRMLSGGMTVAAGIAAGCAFLLLCSDRLAATQRSVYCGYNLPAIRDAMTYLQTVSEPGDVVFTDDWDVFPVYFYHNSYNHYIVGLDPKFTHWRDPELWERYVRITRGQAQRDSEVVVTEADGSESRYRIRVELEDIREHFGAKYVITDRDHKALARQLARAGDFAKLIYPTTAYEECANAPYLIFQVADEVPSPEAPTETDHDAPLYLSELEAIYIEQGWGELSLDRSVSDRPIHLADGFHGRGLGTHAPLELTYAIPDGYDTFEALVGINRGTDGRGSAVVSVEVDGAQAFVGPRITGESEPLRVRVPIRGGERLTLRADPTEDGNRFDHVDWAEARLEKTKQDYEVAAAVSRCGSSRSGVVVGGSRSSEDTGRRGLRRDGERHRAAAGF